MNQELPPDGTDQPDKGGGAKLAIELAPLALFVIAYARTDIITATGVLVAATVLSIAAAWKWLDRIPPMLIVTAVLGVVFGGMTVFFADPRFIKAKPTIVNLLFAAALASGFLTGKPVLKLVMGDSLPKSIPEQVWRTLTWRWIGFFIAMAVLNELIWRNMTETFWVNFKLFGYVPLSIAFMIAQLPLLKPYLDASAKK